MSSALRKARFYPVLYATRLGFHRTFREIPKSPPDPGLPHRPLRIHFWAPQRTAGANVIVHDMLPALLGEISAAGLDWLVSANDQLPSEVVDWLVCFKAVPDWAQVVGNPRKVFLICDQPEVFWGRIGQFDSVVATASRKLAALLTNGHPHVTFVGESEPLDYLAFGARNLTIEPGQRGNVLIWHGGHYSLGPLYDLQPVLKHLAASREMNLHVIGGQGSPRAESWGQLKVDFYPWSRERLFESASQARLGFAPARPSLRLSWLKPGSRVRCLYALGVPAVADARVPDAADFLAEFDGPVAKGATDWSRLLGDLWDSPDKLLQLARAGHASVVAGHSTIQAAWQWIRFFSDA